MFNINRCPFSTPLLFLLRVRTSETIKLSMSFSFKTTNKRGFINTLNNIFVLYKLPLLLKINQVHVFIKIHIHFALPPNYSRAQEKVFFYFLFILFFGHFTFCYKFGGFIELVNQIVTSTCHRVIKHV